MRFFLLVLVFLVCAIPFIVLADDFTAEDAAEMVGQLKQYKQPRSGYFKAVVNETRLGPNKLTYVDKATSLSLTKNVTVYFEERDYRVEWVVMNEIHDGQPQADKLNNHIVAIQYDDKLIDYNSHYKYGHIRTALNMVYQSLSSYPLNHDTMFKYAGLDNYQFSLPAFKGHYITDTPDGPMDVVVLQFPKNHNLITVLGVYQHNKRLGLYKRYKAGQLTAIRKFSNYQPTSSGTLYPRSISYKKIESSLPESIKDKIEKKQLELYDKEVLEAPIIDWEHTYDIQVIDTEINQPIDPLVFSMEYPIGTEVRDMTVEPAIAYTVTEEHTTDEVLSEKTRKTVNSTMVIVFAVIFLGFILCVAVIIVIAKSTKIQK